MAILVSLPVLAFAVILQSTVFSRVPLLNGTVDVVMLVVISWALQTRVRDEWSWALIGGAMVGLVSGLPFWVPVINYLVAVGLGLYLKRRVWQVPVMALFTTVAVGTVLAQLITAGVLVVLQVPIAFGEAFNLVVLPSLLLNLLAALPVNGLVNELGRWMYPEAEV